ncbi:substrate-binding domain-containing protein [Sphingomonas japonica]|uniref:Phosphate transport system substrate-binding protein n=1 Tax=Sphingomonas japonica TaxID=511662 RepID=A0ABX0TYM0_9SPHN|nr:substrate-binding domain-containing protein [Sphingomonas japonica]NIJ22915.1 phosphate transport system substrate-binding protein [Sphingomonas japonica]
MTMRFGFVALAAFTLASCGGGSGAARDQIKIVGSSTVYPFTTKVAEQFVNKNPNLKAPVIESVGSGAGIQLFCAGVGPQHPDIANASRRMKPSEFDLCARNGVQGILEIQVGSDGVVLAEATNGPKLSLSDRDLYLALAANPRGRPNAARAWSDVNPALPNIPIQVLGPPSTSGTRDAFVELVMVPGCKEVDPQAEALEESDPDAFAARCQEIRSDQAYVDKGENDNLIVQGLSTNPNAIGIFGYSYLEENGSRLRGIPLDGITPTYETISNRTYPGARPLFIYVKKQHLRPVPGMQTFLAEYQSSWAPGGSLARIGMIAASAQERAKSARTIAQGIDLTKAELE